MNAVLPTVRSTARSTARSADLPAAGPSARPERLRRLVIGAAVLLAAGAAYVFVVRTFGVGICCPFERLTGYSCPGCGISGIFLSLLRGDIRGAFYSNPLTFCLLPGYAGFIVYLCRQYLTYGYLKIARWIEYVLIGLIAVYVVFGIVRNII